MAHHQRREVEDWLNLFEQQKQSGLTASSFTSNVKSQRLSLVYLGLVDWLLVQGKDLLDE